jgi:hypothetical protein
MAHIKMLVYRFVVGHGMVVCLQFVDQQSRRVSERWMGYLNGQEAGPIARPPESEIVLVRSVDVPDDCRSPS